MIIPVGHPVEYVEMSRGRFESMRFKRKNTSEQFKRKHFKNNLNTNRYVEVKGYSMWVLARLRV